ncbi:hypothetical protein [Virgibacillus doumboii]|uniref:hypothetical protein n=1 Tax=Virgibacillus doumboii TaxID=2697503 RepID=UPI0013DFF674|nr:hypothetical protein [Virgibacillus doumboii]
MDEQRAVSPICPKCQSENTYDFSQEYKNQEPAPFRQYTIGNAKYHCNDCGHEWKKYRGRKPYDRLRVIDVRAGGYMDANRVKINLQTGHVRNALVFGEFSEDDQTLTVTKEKAEWFLEEMYKCDFVNWAEEYHHDGILDGTSWQTNIEYDTYCEIKYGSNHFPKKWAKFCKAISEIGETDFY